MGSALKENTKRFSSICSGKKRFLRQPVCLVVEGKNTEPAYFEWLRSNNWISSKFVLRLDSVEGATAAKNLLKRAERLRKSNRDAIVCIVLDKDQNSAESLNELYQWRDKYPEKCKVAVSIPKFELFLLMHYGEVVGLNTPSEIDARIETVQPGYGRRKIPKMNSLTRENLRRAITLAKLKVNRLPEKDVSEIATLVEWLIK